MDKAVESLLNTSVSRLSVSPHKRLTKLVKLTSGGAGTVYIAQHSVTSEKVILKVQQLIGQPGSSDRSEVTYGWFSHAVLLGWLPQPLSHCRVGGSAIILDFWVL